MTESVRWDIVIDRATDFAMQIHWTNEDNEPYSVSAPIRMQVKSDAGVTAIDFVTDPEMSSLGGASITYNTDLGIIQLAADSSSTDVPEGTYFYDMYATYFDEQLDTSTGFTYEVPRHVKLIEGKFVVKGRITKDV